MKIYILEKTQVEQVSVMNKLLNDALRAKDYKGPDIIENDTELITVVKDKFDKSEVNVKYGKWDKVE